MLKPWKKRKTKANLNNRKTAQVHGLEDTEDDSVPRSSPIPIHVSLGVFHLYADSKLQMGRHRNGLAHYSIRRISVRLLLPDLGLTLKLPQVKQGNVSKEKPGPENHKIVQKQGGDPFQRCRDKETEKGMPCQQRSGDNQSLKGDSSLRMCNIS